MPASAKFILMVHAQKLHRSQASFCSSKGNSGLREIDEHTSSRHVLNSISMPQLLAVRLLQKISPGFLSARGCIKESVHTRRWNESSLPFGHIDMLLPSDCRPSESRSRSLWSQSWQDSDARGFLRGDPRNVIFDSDRGR